MKQKKKGRHTGSRASVCGLSLCGTLIKDTGRNLNGTLIKDTGNLNGTLIKNTGTYNVSSERFRSFTVLRSSSRPPGRWRLIMNLNGILIQDT